MVVTRFEKARPTIHPTGGLRSTSQPGARIRPARDPCTALECSTMGRRIAGAALARGKIYRS
jgi:hypothetical protein